MGVRARGGVSMFVWTSNWDLISSWKKILSHGTQGSINTLFLGTVLLNGSISIFFVRVRVLNYLKSYWIAVLWMSVQLRWSFFVPSKISQTGESHRIEMLISNKSVQICHWFSIGYVQMRKNNLGKFILITYFPLSSPLLVPGLSPPNENHWSTQYLPLSSNS